MVDSVDMPEGTLSDFVTLSDEQRQIQIDDEENNFLAQVEKVYQLWWRWADFHIFIITPTIDILDPPIIIPPEPISGSTELEFVYPIHDHGYKLSTSKGQDIFSAGLSMCKLYYTIEKMIFILVERLKAAGIAPETEVQVAFDGHELAQRKTFESIINLSYNVVVTNFDPGAWGERYLQIAKGIADLGYGYPAEAPRDNYRKVHGTTPNRVKR